MYKLMVIEFETNESPNTSIIYDATVKLFGDELRWCLLYAAGIKGNENPCRDWGIEPTNGKFLIDRNSVQNFNQTDENEVHDALFAASLGSLDFASANWQKKSFYDQIVFSLRIVEREIYEIYSADWRLFDELKKFSSILSAKIFSSSDAINWSEIS